MLRSSKFDGHNSRVMALTGHKILISDRIDDFEYPKYAFDLPTRLEELGAEVVLGIEAPVEGPKVHHVIPVYQTVSAENIGPRSKRVECS